MGYKERNEIIRTKFLQEIKNIDPSYLIFVDEAGVDNNEVYPYGWCLRGQRLNMFKMGCRTQRVSIIGALNSKKTFCPSFF